MSKITINTTGKWQLYWGPSPLPQHSKAIGTVTRDGYDTGALILIEATGIYVQGNAASIRSLPQRDIIIGLHMAEVGARGGSATSPAKTRAVRRNAKLGGRPPKRKAKRHNNSVSGGAGAPYTPRAGSQED